MAVTSHTILLLLRRVDVRRLEIAIVLLDRGLGLLQLVVQLADLVLDGGGLLLRVRVGLLQLLDAALEMDQGLLGLGIGYAIERKK